jgi:hypothetical protein
MNNNHTLRRLITYIEENLRASKTSGIEFIDPRNHKDRLVARQNHVVFGRRGAGKSTLLSSLAREPQIVLIQIDLEDYKDITFPNIVLQVLASLLAGLEKSVQSHNPWYRFARNARVLRRDLRSEIKKLKSIFLDPDTEERVVRTLSRREAGGGIGAGANAASARIEASKQEEVEVSRTLPYSKMDHLLNQLTFYKVLLNQASELCENKPVFLSLDDYYFIKKGIQPDLLDYFHRMTKDTTLYLKIATIKNRSFLYKRTRASYVGIELGHDVFEVDLDYTLDNFADLRSFMEQLLNSANAKSEANVDIGGLFAGDGFTQLCLASGGVPRDFLTLFVRLVTNTVLQGTGSIGKVEVNEEAIANINSKLESLKLDSGTEDVFLEEYLSVIRSRVYSEKRTNAFLVAKPELEAFPQSRQAIRELVDLRLIHVVDKNTSSAPSDGRRYEAYIVDVGLYENSRPRNFNQIEPGVADEKSRKDAIRAAPRISLPEVEQTLAEQGIQLDLFTFDAENPAA